MNQEEMMKVLDTLYEKSIKGIPNVSPPINELAEQYLCQFESVEKAARSFNKYQIAKCTTSGFLTGLGGLITLPVAIPANIGSVMYVQMRMIACLAYMGGYETDSDQVQTLVYACLAGISLDQLIKHAGIQVGTKLTMAMIKRLPGKVLTAINKKVGFRLVTKFGTKGVINLGKMIPVIGGVVGGGFDFAETKVIAKRAFKMFIEGDISASANATNGSDGEAEPMDADFAESEE